MSNWNYLVRALMHINNPRDWYIAILDRETRFDNDSIYIFNEYSQFLLDYSKYIPAFALFL